MNVLFDTHTFLWWITDSSQLSSRVRAIISDGNNKLFFSAASAWEIAIKAQLGKLVLPKIPEQFIFEQLLTNSIESLPIQLNHAVGVYHLPNHHKDPFDRILISQSRFENLPILTLDPLISQYDVNVIW
ncbi:MULTISPECIES: type II toxin-antitoxin system VapC family toxin [Calothrix]|uniref:Type II toxin-antitoxin system VapC family toxin n=2 Tax=Calothrix TaxID=1186 RepID=A0ABR8AIP6_9CYAN|nr:MULTISPECIES: type II toxin-antitoxin system VapC family toxin [Calothrix]MBD2199907.1 type II toxin-antitoxin system VapC family toxin [Calothrix parietina FACHB-288]MBD2228746.1 type II toxin-antitoxin system VapC family toxin [Calothrix anomala FACHB-343]